MLEQAVRICPDNYKLLATLGNGLWLAERPVQALASYREAVQLAPGDPVVYRGLANVYVDLGRFEEADRAYRRSFALAADVATAWNHSQLLVGLERYAEGNALAEARWGMDGVKAYRGALRRCTSVEELVQGPLRVWSEQGFGDTLQHLRWVGPLLQLRRGARDAVVLEVEPCLVRLLEEALLPAHGELVVRAKDPNGAEASEAAHLSLLSLPHFLGGAPLPASSAWLQGVRWPVAPEGVVPERSGEWLPRRGARIGVVWAAGRKLEDPFQRREYAKRSLPLKALGRLVSGLRQAGLQPVNLQFGPDRQVGMTLEPGFVEALAEEADFAATAELVAGLDLVITVDTAMAHLVGAMARPGWLLLPWAAAPRWLRVRTDSPWYPSLRLFRQPQPGDWLGAVDTVLAAASRA
ncbi:tetratricopeptide repeat protein [Synechococcus sp. GreenBA-s]|nr:tetratricopeptide repeat protein [Synechococcus sp. GreenBA-s]